jgi:hypothetical protein
MHMIAVVLATVLAQMQPTASPAEPSAAPPPASAAPGGIFRHLPVDFPTVGPNDAVIRNSGSTNTTGYTIVVHPDFHAQIYSNGVTQDRTIAAPQAKWLFEQLNAAMPLDMVGVGRCMKSASFGTTTTIRYRGQVTPDLSCGGGSTARELMRTAGVIVNQVGVPPTMGMRRRLE